MIFWKPTLFCFIFLFLAWGCCVLAQTAVYATFTAGNLGVGGTDWIYGGQAGIYHDFQPIPMIHVGVDGRAQILDRGRTKLISGLAGPRIALKPWAIPVRPYVEALFGAGHLEFDVFDGNLRQTASETDFEYQILGGLDLTVLPHIDWRVGEFSYGG